ncbi:hypothetical protein [Streptomyces sp. NBC_00162]|uniref:hypothetical protein n=1 Tax=Streptomyces sp. NBC_00162 TaxID=2903629 RepID=UPI00214C761C|nr:hypothetical protein [Streptomyces sp. NBC_00162]UUU37733.1 hypothetical protein JIW86_01710 [Streptomyces sp. NBC_00162]
MRTDLGGDGSIVRSAGLTARFTELLPGGLCHAFWLTPDDHGRERHEFYGFTVPASGTAAGV